MEGDTKLSLSLKALRKYLDEADDLSSKELNKLGWFAVGNATKALNDGEMLTLNCP